MLNEYGSFMNTPKSPNRPRYNNDRVMRLELAMLLDEAKEHHKSMNKTALNKNAKEAAKIALKLGTLHAAMQAAIIRNMEVESRKFKKRGRFMVRND